MRCLKLILVALLSSVVAIEALAEDAIGGSFWAAGVNLPVGTFGKGGKLHFDYTYPKPNEIDYYKKKGFDIIRLGFKASRLFVQETCEVVQADYKLLSSFIEGATAQDMYVILDMHDYGLSPSGLVIGRDESATLWFLSVWECLSARFKDNDRVVFGLMNEPYKQSAEEWFRAARDVVLRIRATGARNLILVPGTSWSGAHSWLKSGNAQHAGLVTDPVGRLAFEVHQYLDSDSSGTRPEVVPGSGQARLRDVNAWARRTKQRLFLGEFGFASTPEAMAEGRDLLKVMADNKDVWIGWSYWAAGTRWGDYPFSVEPKDGRDAVQMGLLEEFAR